jgi:Zn-dependent metalloprotease
MFHRMYPSSCIISEDMLKRISENGTPAQREWAERSLKATAQLTGQRALLTGYRDIARRDIAALRDCTTYDAEHGTALPGTQIRCEGDPPVSDAAVNEAHDGAQATYDLYQKVYERNSIDNRGMKIISSVHYDHQYENAFWNGEQMVYGDGDEELPEAERLFNRFTICLDIIGHELTHGVTQFSAGLAYWQQPGALNESCSDIGGSLVLQKAQNQSVDEAHWIIGKGLFSPNVHGDGIRSMKAPGEAYDDPVLGKDPQPAHMRDYKDMGSQDSGGVHINSGIPNHAFYVTAKELGGNAWEKAGHIWYVTLTKKIRPTSNFQDAASLTVEAAGQLYGAGSLEQQAVRKGWNEVGISTDGRGCISAVVDLIAALGRRST